MSDYFTKQNHVFLIIFISISKQGATTAARREGLPSLQSMAVMRAPALSDALTPADLSPRLTPHSTLQMPNSLPILRETSQRAPLEMATLPPEFASLRATQLSDGTTSETASNDSIARIAALSVPGERAGGGDALQGEGAATRIASVPVLVPARIVAPLPHDEHSSRGSLGSILFVFSYCATQLISIKSVLMTLW